MRGEGTFAMMINFTRAFDSAWERTMVILFRPFNIQKWVFIGFNAFLTVLAEGGISFNQSFPLNKQDEVNTLHLTLPFMIHSVKQWIASIGAVAASAWVMLYLVAGFVLLCAWLALFWVGCRGEFMFTDNIVRNRAAVAQPWKRYARQGNAWFFFNLGLTVVTVILALLSAGTFVGVDWSWISAERDPNGNEKAILGLLVLVLGVVWIVYHACVFLIRSFAQSLMFKETFTLKTSLKALVQLVTTYPLDMLLYLLASLGLAIAGGLLCLMVACVTCCCLFVPALIPFAGSIITSAILVELILPVLVYYRCFQLDCLAQFGPQYDVWIVDVPPSVPAPDAPVSPPLPPG